MSSEFSGLLRERILIERPSLNRDAAGIREDGWAPVCSCLAAVSPDGAGAEREGMALSAMSRIQVVIRFREDVTIDQRIGWRGRNYLVRQLTIDPRSIHRMTLRCEETRQ